MSVHDKLLFICSVLSTTFHDISLIVQLALLSEETWQSLGGNQ